MQLIIIDEKGRKNSIVEANKIKKSFQNKPFLHLVFNKREWIVTFCSISNRFLLMDKEAFDSFGKFFLAKNRMLPLIKFSPRFHFFSPVITSKCNLECSYCFGGSKERKGMVSSWTIVKNAIDYIAQQNKPIIVSYDSVGEQMSDFKAFKRTLDYIKKKLKIKKIIVSVNGTGDPNLYLQVVDKFDVFQVSFDGLPEIQDKQRALKGGGKSSVLVEKTIKKLVENNKQFKVKITVTNLHIGREEEVFKYLQTLGVENVILGIVTSLGYGKEYLKRIKQKQSWESLIASLTKTELKIKELCNSFGLKSSIVTERLFEIKGLVYCPLGYGFSVGADGVVSACHAYADKDDINVHKGMSDLLIGKFDSQKERFEIDKKKLNELRNWQKKVKCADCDFKLCWGGCPVENFRENKSIFLPSKIVCITRKKQARELLKTFAEERVIKIKPCLIERNKKLFYSMQFSEFKLNKSNLKNLKGNSFIKFNPIKQNFSSLFKKILSLSKKNKKKITLFLLSPTSSERLSLRASARFKRFLFNLEENKILFKITRPIKITDSSSEKEKGFYDFFSIPKTCFDCLEMFKIKNNQIEFCNGIKGPKINEVFNREEIYSIFKKNIQGKKCHNFR